MREHRKISKSAHTSLYSKILLMLFFCFSSVAFISAQKKITGVVVDDKKIPLVGVNVTVKGTTKGATAADYDGKYSIEVPNNEAVLVFTMTGLKPTEVTVGSQTTVDVVMADDEFLLDEVAVIGFQTQKKVNVTAAVTSMGREAFENKPVSNIGQALQGLVPNLNINIKTGAPGEVPSFNVRGGTSMVLDKDDTDKKRFIVENGSPLILVDGVEVNGEALNQLNPQDIENFSLLKDASAAAIYGTRATFGVILVTTKRGSFDQKAQVSYSYDVSWDRIKETPDLLSSRNILKSNIDRRIWTDQTPITAAEEQELEMLQRYMDNPIPENAWYTLGTASDPSRNAPIWVANNDPYKDAIRSWTPMQKHNVSISGGGKSVSYYVSLGAQEQSGILKISEDKTRRYNFLTSINAKLYSWFNLGAKVSYNIKKDRTPTSKPGQARIWLALKGQDPQHHKRKPIFTGPNDPVPNAPTENILSYYSTGGIDKRTRTMAIYTISPEFVIIPKELTIKADLSLTPITYERHQTTPRQARMVDSWISFNTYGTQDNTGEIHKTTTDSYIINAYANYTKSLNKKHNITALLGVNQERETYNSTVLYLKKMLDPHILNPENVETETENTSKTAKHAITARALFGRLLYDYEGRYLFEFDARYDGSSKFPKSDRFQFFPTFSAGWRLSHEKFMDWSRTWLDDFKLRGSWGKLGSQPSGPYSYQDFFEPSSSNYWFNGTSIPNTVSAPGLVNPNLTWAQATSRNIGLDVTALRNRFSGTFDVFERVVNKILIPGGKQYPALLGASPPLENVGKITSKGWEISLKWRDKLDFGMHYDLGFTISDNTSKVNRFEGNETKMLTQRYPGEKLGEIWGYETGGILQEEDFDVTVAADGKKTYKYNGPNIGGNQTLYPGYIWYKDLNNDGMINSGDGTASNNGDKKIIGNSTPRYRYAITAGASYKGVDVSMVFTGVPKRDVDLGAAASYWGAGAGSQWMYDRSWTPGRTNARFPMYGASQGSTSQSAYLLDGSYFRMKQLIIGYTLPKEIISKLRGVNKLRVNFSAHNLFTITDLPKYYEPEEVSDQYPVSQTFALGVQIGF